MLGYTRKCLWNELGCEFNVQELYWALLSWKDTAGTRGSHLLITWLSTAALSSVKGNLPTQRAQWEGDAVMVPATLQNRSDFSEPGTTVLSVTPFPWMCLCRRLGTEMNSPQTSCCYGWAVWCCKQSRALVESRGTLALCQQTVVQAAPCQNGLVGLLPLTWHEVFVLQSCFGGNFWVIPAGSMLYYAALML